MTNEILPKCHVKSDLGAVDRVNTLGVIADNQFQNTIPLKIYILFWIIIMYFDIVNL